jgi:hypothetical protein
VGRRRACLTTILNIIFQIIIIIKPSIKIPIWARVYGNDFFNQNFNNYVVKCLSYLCICINFIIKTIEKITYY